MPESVPMATFRKRNSGRWQAIVRKVGAPPESKAFATKAAAKRWAARIEHEIDEGRARGGNRPATGTLGALIERYEREIGAIKGFGRSKTSSLGLIKAGLGHVRLRDLSADHVIRFAHQRHADGAGAATVGVDLAYLRTMLKTARSLWQFATSERPVIEARDALRHVGLVGKSAERDRRVTEYELEALFAHWRAMPRLKLPMIDLVQFAIGSAMRLSEITRLAWIDLDTTGRLITVRQRKDPRRRVDQRVPLVDATGYDPLKIILDQPGGSERIFPLNERSIGTAFRRACKDCGIPDLRFHDLRHEATSRLFESGMPLEQVALISGHKTWANLRRYANLKPENVVKAASLPRGPRAT